MSQQNPVAITVNGKEDTVVLGYQQYTDIENYISEMEAKLRVYDHLAQAADDIKLGRVQSLDDAFDDVLNNINQIEIWVTK